MRKITFANNVVKLISFFVLFDINASKGTGRNGLLQNKLLDPIILVLDSQEQGLTLKALLNGFNDATVHDRGMKPRASSDNKGFSFYDLLRSHTQEELLENKKVDKHTVDDEADKYLHQALRMRCGSLGRCVDKCPKKEKYYCSVSCQQVIDEDNMCEEPPQSYCNPKRESKCGNGYGRTFPPRWRKQLLRAKHTDI